jgi:protein-disulfide isomerase
LEALLDEEVGSKVEAPSDVEVEAFYEQNQARIRAPLEQVRSQVAQLLLSTRMDEARGKLVAALRANSEVSVFLDPPRMRVNLDHAPLRGPETAAVTIVEFSDFQCPFCRRVQPTLAEVQKKYGDKIRWSFKDLPLVSIHPDAQKAAEAARCAGEQDKFWEYRAAMFEAAKISSELHEATADKLGLDKPAFDACLQSDRYQAAVQADSDEAQSLGISGTPAFVINGIVLSGAQPLEAFVNVIDAELARAK